MRAKPRIPDEVGGYVVAITRGFRRLHLLGACPRVPGIDYHDFEEYGMERPEVTEYDDYCKSCWGTLGAGPDEESDLESASDFDGN